jgi:hypothetical protein
MPDTKISALTNSTTPPAATDAFVTVENMGSVPATKRKAWSVLAATVSSQIILFGPSMTIPVTSGAVPGSKIELVAGQTVLNSLPSFTNGVNLYGQWNFEMPGDWNAGTFTYEVFWICATATNANVIWGLQALGVPDNGPMWGTWGTAIEVTTANTYAGYYLTKSAVSGAVTPAVTGGSLAAGMKMLINLYHKGASDAIGYPVLLDSVRLNYTRA